jgi:DNA-directed RNA polymerase III subunit RPC1
LWVSKVCHNCKVEASIDLYLPVSIRKKLTDCAGHFGYIQLELPVFHAGYFRHTLTILQCVCKQCSRVLLHYEDRMSFLKKLRGPKQDALSRAGTFKRIVDICKRTSTCPYCGFANGKFLKILYR